MPGRTDDGSEIIKVQIQMSQVYMSIDYAKVFITFKYQTVDDYLEYLEVA